LINSSYFVKLIELKEVTREYNKVPVLQDVNMAIEEGELLSIIGPSGSGKTTLLNLISGFLEPTKGQVLYYSKITQKPEDLTRNLHRVKNRLGFTPQHNSFYPKLTVKENLLHFGDLHGLKRETLIANVKSLLQFTKLFDHGDKLAEDLSGGMQRRLDISCSLVHKPKLLLLDEPTAELDPKLQAEILQLLQEVNKQGVTIVIASNQLDIVEKVSTKVALIHRSRVRMQGSLEEIRKPFLRDHFTINLHHISNRIALLEALKKMPVSRIVEEEGKVVVYPHNVEQTLQHILAVIKQENLYLHDVDLRQPTLQEIFEKVTSDQL